jgi:hypothetical protein
LSEFSLTRRLGFTSCKKEDNIIKDEVDSFDIIGKWNIDEDIYNIYIDGVAVEAETVRGGWLEFKNEGKGIDDEGNAFEWTLYGDILDITYRTESGIMTMGYSIISKSKSKMTLKSVASWTENNQNHKNEYILELSK